MLYLVLLVKFSGQLSVNIYVEILLNVRYAGKYLFKHNLQYYSCFIVLKRNCNHIVNFGKY